MLRRSAGLPKPPPCAHCEAQAKRSGGRCARELLLQAVIQLQLPHHHRAARVVPAFSPQAAGEIPQCGFKLPPSDFYTLPEAFNSITPHEKKFQLPQMQQFAATASSFHCRQGGWDIQGHPPPKTTRGTPKRITEPHRGLLSSPDPVQLCHELLLNTEPRGQAGGEGLQGARVR